MTKNALSESIAATLGSPDKPVKPANPRRGAGYRDAAIDFIQLYPVGSTLTWDEFAQFAIENDLLDIASLPTEEEMADKQSNGWLAYLQRRHQARAKLNNACAHPALIPYGGAFTVEASKGALVVRSTASALAESDAPQKIATLATTKRKKIEYLIQSTDWSLLPPHERALAESVRDDIDNFVALVDLQATQLQNKFTKLRHNISQLVKVGQVKPVNGGISGLLENDD
jgi:hypothetical protein